MLILFSQVTFLRYEDGNIAINVLYCYLLPLIFEKVLHKKQVFCLINFRKYRLLITEKLIMDKRPL